MLFRDHRFVVLDKPAGLAAHAGPRGGASVEDCFPELSRRRDGPWLVHRLDADTSGCLVVALRRAALHAAQAVFAEGRAEKEYWAVVRGGPVEEEGVVDAPLLKVSDRSGWRVVVAAREGRGGQRARTGWRVMGRSVREGGGGMTWLALRPETGRTHQVRVHCAWLGCPVMGDPVYGNAREAGGQGRLQLLARSILLPLDPVVMAKAPVPAHMSGAMSECGYDCSPHAAA